MSKTLILKGEGYTISLSPEAVQLRDQKVVEAQGIIQVTSAQEEQIALAKAGELKGISKACERNREEIKAPALAIGRLIDDNAKSFSGPLKTESDRLESLCGAFRQIERDKVLAYEREAEKERQRLAEIERQRAQAEIAAAQAKTKKERLAAELKAEELREQQLNAELEQAAKIPAPIVAPAPAVGGSVKPEFDIEVVNIDALFVAYPDAVELVVKKSVLNDLVYRRGIQNIPGVKLTPKVTVRARAAAPLPALEYPGTITP